MCRAIGYNSSNERHCSRRSISSIFSKYCGLYACNVSVCPRRTRVLAETSSDGASLHFVSQAIPATLARLRAYILHRLFTETQSSASASEAILRSYPFPHRANAIDRDSLLIPAGWDSYGKIKVLRDGFQPQRVAAGWRKDCGLNKPDEEDAQSLRQEYESLVRDIAEVGYLYIASMQITADESPFPV